MCKEYNLAEITLTFISLSQCDYEMKLIFKAILSYNNFRVVWPRYVQLLQSTLYTLRQKDQFKSTGAKGAHKMV